MKWTKDIPREDGYYWWRASVKDKYPEVVEICDGTVCDIRDGEYHEHEDFSGEWSNIPIPVPSSCETTTIKQYCGINVTEQEIKDIEKFESLHLNCSKGKGLLQFIITPGSIGGTTVVKCIECKKELDITDTDLW